MKPAKLTVKWSKKEKDIVVRYPSKPDGHYISDVFSKQVIEELNKRGYDTTTLTFSVSRKPTHPSELCKSAAERLESKYKDTDWLLFVEPVLFAGGSSNYLIVWTNRKIDINEKEFEGYNVEWKTR